MLNLPNEEKFIVDRNPGILQIHLMQICSIQKFCSKALKRIKKKLNYVKGTVCVISSDFLSRAKNKSEFELPSAKSMGQNGRRSKMRNFLLDYLQHVPIYFGIN